MERETGLCLEMQLCVGSGLKHPLGFLCPSLGYSKAHEGHAAPACTAVLQLLQVKPAGVWGPTATSPPPKVVSFEEDLQQALPWPGKPGTKGIM